MGRSVALEQAQDDAGIDSDTLETMDAKKLAEKLGIDVKDVYDIRFPYGEDGDALSLGELKDIGIRARTIDDDTERLSQRREKFVNENMRSRQELQNIVGLLPDIPPGLKDAAIRQHAAVQQTERINLLETMPTWRDPGIEAKARTDILDRIG